MAYKLALVDFDGTLADSMPYWLDLPEQTLRRNGIAPPEGFNRLIRDLPMMEVGKIFSRDYPQLDRLGPLNRYWEACMDENYHRRISLLPGAAELLRYLRDHGLAVWLISATPHSILDSAVKHFGLWELADRVLTEEDTGSKHRPDAYHFCANAFGCSLEEMLLVEDSLPNIRMAAELGLGTVAVRESVLPDFQPELQRIADVYTESWCDLSVLDSLFCR